MITKSVFSKEMATYYTKVAEFTLNKEIKDKVMKIAEKVAEDIVESFDIEKMLYKQVKGTNKMIITLVMKKTK